jgi:hypothetical protein
MKRRESAAAAAATARLNEYIENKIFFSRSFINDIIIIIKIIIIIIYKNKNVRVYIIIHTSMCYTFEGIFFLLMYLCRADE